MNLLIDLGNSRMKWALAADERIEASACGSCESDLSACLDRDWRNLPTPDHVVMSAVVADRAKEVEDVLWARWNRRPHVVRAEPAAFGVTNRYADPARLGSDRWAALVGARAKYSGALCVIDCGTALTFNALTAEGDFLGGAIMPGLTAARACLRERTHGIGTTAGSDASAIARTTGDAVAAGTAFGLAGAIERLVEEYRVQLGSNMQVLVTGGDAVALLRHVRISANSEPDLVLIGLAVIARGLA